MLLDDVYVMWIPVLVIAGMGALGAWRGVYRELGVSAAIALAALIIVQWATRDRWPRDLSQTITGLGEGEWQFFLSLVLMVLIVAVVGYGLGGIFARRGNSTTSRTLGALLGLANGAALTGWVLRGAYDGLGDRQQSSIVYQNPISQSLMIWAEWFPVVLAVLGAIAALALSLRGESTEAPATAMREYEPAHSTGAIQGVPARAGYVPPAQPAYYEPPPQFSRTDIFTAYPGGSNTSGQVPSRQDSSMAPTMANQMPPTTAPPLRSATLAPHEQSQEIWSGPLAATPVRREVSSEQTATPATITSSIPTTEPAPTITASVPTTEPPAPSPDTQTATRQTPPFGYDISSLWSGYETGSQPAQEAGSETGQNARVSEAEAATASAVAESPTQEEKRCQNCGSRLQPGAIFCTECGSRVSET